MSESTVNFDSENLGVRFAGLHLAAFLFSAILAQQGQGWAGVYIWPVWFLIDLPWSLLHLLMEHPSIDSWIEELRSDNTALSYILYSPYLVHGFIGTIWWFFVPKIYFWSRHLRAPK
jgi:hypothetical protein